MESRLAKELRLCYQPIVVILSDEKPEGALMLKEGARGCVMALVTQAAKGRTVAFDRKTVRCGGGGAGLGFGNTYARLPGFEYFLSVGGHGYGEGEAYKKTPELARSIMDQLPTADIPFTYVVMRPLGGVRAPIAQPAEARVPEAGRSERSPETPVLVIFYANPDQLSALVVLANYDRPSNDNVIVRMSSGCQSICLIPYMLGQDRPQKAVSASPTFRPGPTWTRTSSPSPCPGKCTSRWRATSRGASSRRRPGPRSGGGSLSQGRLHYNWASPLILFNLALDVGDI